MLLPELCADELAQRSDELSKAAQIAADRLDQAPGDFNTHVVVAPGISSMTETHPATIARPVVATPIGGFVTIFVPDIIDKQSLDPIRKFWNTNLASVHHKS